MPTDCCRRGVALTRPNAPTPSVSSERTYTSSMLVGKPSRSAGETSTEGAERVKLKLFFSAAALVATSMRRWVSTETLAQLLRGKQAFGKGRSATCALRTAGARALVQGRCIIITVGQGVLGAGREWAMATSVDLHTPGSPQKGKGHTPATSSSSTAHCLFVNTRQDNQQQ
jgi:hypothetical protein